MVSADAVASVILSRHGSWMTAMELQKLLYYVQAWHLAVTDETLFPEKFKAWANGPVVPQVWHSRKEPRLRDPQAGSVDSEAELDDMSSDIIDLVLETYGSLSGDELSALTHTERPWVEARGDTPEGEGSSEPLSWARMAEFYRSDRLLGGQRAADLAAGGIHARHEAPVDIDIHSILASIESPEPTDRWGGGNLALAHPSPVRDENRGSGW